MSLIVESRLTLEDRLAIHELIALYGHIIDERQFSRLSEIFTPNAVYDLTDYGGECHYGLTAIEQMMRASDEHPLAHHATNIVIIAEDDEIRVVSKGIGVGYKGRVGSVTYRDRLEREAAGWRIKLRVCELRRADRIPDIS